MRSVIELVACSAPTAWHRGVSQSDTRGARATTLHCEWIETGDPAQPVACKWYGEELTASRRIQAGQNSGIQATKEHYGHVSHFPASDCGRRASR
jgi:hypothetical protein